MVHYIALQAVHYKPLQEVHLSRYNQRNAILLRSSDGRRPVTLIQVGPNVTAHFDENHFCVVKDVISIANINIEDTIVLGESISNAENV